SLTDALSRTTAYSYDSMGNLTNVTLLSGTSGAVTTTFACEATFNQVISVTDPLNHITAYGRDSTGNVSSVTDALPNRTVIAYNVSGQPTSVADPLNSVWQYGYSSGDLVSMANPLGQTSTSFVDAAGRVVSKTNAAGQRVSFTFDGDNRPTSVTDPIGGV